MAKVHCGLLLTAAEDHLVAQVSASLNMSRSGVMRYGFLQLAYRMGYLDQAPAMVQGLSYGEARRIREAFRASLARQTEGAHSAPDL